MRLGEKNRRRGGTGKRKKKKGSGVPSLIKAPREGHPEDETFVVRTARLKKRRRRRRRRRVETKTGSVNVQSV